MLETAAGQPLTLFDVPHVEQVHVAITELLFAVHEDDNDRMTAWDLKYPDGGN